MARRSRYTPPGVPQHVTQRGNNRLAMFAGPSDYRFFLECLKRACDRYGCQVHAYTLMTNHIHLLLTPRDAEAVGRVMQSATGRYVKYFNYLYRRTGTLFEGRYRSSLVDTERYLLACHRYIELNPVRAGLATDPAGYPWSSYRANALGARDPIVTPHGCYERLGASPWHRRDAYRALFAFAFDERMLGEIRIAIRQGQPPGIGGVLARRGQTPPAISAGGV